MKKKKSALQKWIMYSSMAILFTLAGVVIFISVYVVFFPDSSGDNFYRDMGYMAAPKGDYQPVRDDYLVRSLLAEKAIEIEERENGRKK